MIHSIARRIEAKSSSLLANILDKFEAAQINRELSNGKGPSWASKILEKHGIEFGERKGIVFPIRYKEYEFPIRTHFLKFDSENTPELISKKKIGDVDWSKIERKMGPFTKDPDISTSSCNNSNHSLKIISNTVYDRMSEQVQLETVKQDGYSIKYIENPSEQVQIEAVKQDGYSIRDIKNPSEAVQIEAVKRDGRSIAYVKNPSEEVQLEAVKQNPYSIQFIKNPSEKVQLKAVSKNPKLIEYIKNPTQKVLDLVEVMRVHNASIRIMECT